MAVHSQLRVASSTTVGPAWLVPQYELGCFVWNPVLESRHQVLSLYSALFFPISPCEASLTRPRHAFTAAWQGVVRDPEPGWPGKQQG